jgi:cell division septal protein FtsQ
MKSKLFKILRIVFVVSSLGCVASLVWAGYHYMHTDPRFNLRKVTVSDMKHSDLKHVDDDEILSRIRLNTDGNTNIFAVDMDDVRTRVEQLEWVRHANVQRVLPDTVLIRVDERDPLGVARLHGRLVEFDDEAAILEPDEPGLPALPVLLELEENNIEANRLKIAMYRKVVAELGGEDITQVIVNSEKEVSIVRKDDPLIVCLGTDDFKDRWDRYLKLKEVINANYKNAVHVDMRFRNKVIVNLQDDDSGGKVIWDGKKKSL